MTARRNAKPPQARGERVEPNFGARAHLRGSPARPCGSKARWPPLSARRMCAEPCASRCVLGFPRACRPILYFISRLPDPVAADPRRPTAQPHHPRRRRHRACRAGLAPRLCPARPAAALSAAGRDRHRGSPLLQSSRRRSGRPRCAPASATWRPVAWCKAARPSPSSSPRTCSSRLTAPSRASSKR